MNIEARYRLFHVISLALLILYLKVTTGLLFWAILCYFTYACYDTFIKELYIWIGKGNIFYLEIPLINSLWFIKIESNPDVINGFTKTTGYINYEI